MIRSKLAENTYPFQKIAHEESVVFTTVSKNFACQIRMDFDVQKKGKFQCQDSFADGVRKDILCLNLRLKSVIFVVYPRSTQEHFNARTPTWLNHKEERTQVKFATQLFKSFFKASF